MTETSPVNRVVKALTDAGYQLLTSPILIAGVPFTFPAVLVATDHAFDLVVVVDTVTETDQRLGQQVGAVARALDVAGSKRSLTVVSVGPPIAPTAATQISQVARLLVTPAHGSDSPTLGDALAVLLPLRPPEAGTDTSDPFASVLEWIDSNDDRSVLDRIADAAAEGPAAVAGELARFLSAPFAPTGEGAQ